MKIFITGGTGFIGQPIVRIFAAHGHKVLLLSRAPKKYANSFNGKHVQFLKGDLSHIYSIKNKIENFRPDVILHLAWEGVLDYRSPENSVKNLKNSLDFLLFAVSISCKKIVCAGSGLEYGTLMGRVNERTEVHPSNVFEAAKTALHDVGKEIAKKNGVQFVWARIFHSYGPGQRPAALIPYLVRCLKDGTPPTIKNPKTAHDYIYVDDVASAFAKIVLKKNLKSDAYNIGSGRLASAGEIAAIVQNGKALGHSPKKGAGRYTDISKIKKELGWQPLVDIERGIKKTIAYYI